jgi:hypothetical protein
MIPRSGESISSSSTTSRPNSPGPQGLTGRLRFSVALTEKALPVTVRGAFLLYSNCDHH